MRKITESFIKVLNESYKDKCSIKDCSVDEMIEAYNDCNLDEYEVVEIATDMADKVRGVNSGEAADLYFDMMKKINSMSSRSYVSNSRAIKTLFNFMKKAEDLIKNNKVEMNESVNPDQSYVNFLKQDLGDTYKETSDDNSFVITGTDKGGAIAAVWTGKAKKPQIYARYRDEAQRDEAIAKYLQRVTDRQKENAEWRQKRRLTRDHNVKVGDIYYTCWGYDQTNIDYYQVVAVRGSRIDLKELNQDYVSRGEGAYDDEVAPVKDSFSSDEIHTVSARADGTLTNLDGESFLGLSLWDGKPKYQTNPYSGH